MLFKDSEQAKAKWDQGHKSHYIPKDKDPVLFEQWAICLPKPRPKDYSQQKSVQSGVFKEDAISLDDV
ncbi:MAG: hypothetical protein HRT36_07250 [Alphaproteobacteria bacterium]|nr:hypothetical protein [Alphaproteobacteria bacterium]